MNELAQVGGEGDVDLATTPITYKTLPVIARTEFVPLALRGNVPAILACILSGRELGLGPMESLQKIDMIDGRPSPSAELLVALVFRAGHEIYPEDVTDQAATAVARRKQSDGSWSEPRRFTFTRAMAERVKDRGGKALVEKANYRNYPEAMLYWRAASQLCRWVFPDVVTAFRAYTPDELGDENWAPPDPATMAAPDEAEGEEEVVEAEVVEPAADSADDMWTHTLNIVSDDSWLRATLPVIEEATRTLCDLMEKQGFWKAEPNRDVLHTMLREFAATDGNYQNDPKANTSPQHYSDLGRKVHKVTFARWLIAKGRETVKAQLEKEHTDDQAD